MSAIPEPIFIQGRYSWAKLYCGDCREIAPTLEGVDACVSDPPWGMNLDTDNSRFSGGEAENIAKRGNGIGTANGAPVIGDDQPFDPAPWLSFPKVVLFGSNHFGQRLPVGTTLIWLKRNDDAFGSFLSDGELAWMKGGHGVYAKRDLSNNANTATRFHPTQKPVPLMAWCMDMAKIPTGATVLDPYAGSFSTGVACAQTRRNFIGIEISEHYFSIAEKRIREELESILL